jgi:TatD DNase family protein
MNDDNVIFDVHCHMQFLSYDKDREEVINRARNAGVKMIVIGVDTLTSREAVKLSYQYPDDIWATAGIHPHNTDEDVNVDFRDLAKDRKTVAIGECGLDYFGIKNDESEIKDLQKKIFLKQVKLANELQKPLMIHCRSSVRGSDDAYEDIYKLLITNYQLPITKIMHFFAGSLEIVKKFIEEGFYFTFGGVITITRDYDKIVKYAPLDRILLETDAPYVAPLTHRGKRNEPALILETARKLAEIKNMSYEKVVENTLANSLRVFKIKFSSTDDSSK